MSDPFLVTKPVHRIVALREGSKVVLRRVVVAYRYWHEGVEIDLMGGPAPKPPRPDPPGLWVRYLWQQYRLVFWAAFWIAAPWYVWKWIAQQPFVG